MPSLPFPPSSQYRKRGCPDSEPYPSKKPVPLGCYKITPCDPDPSSSAPQTPSQPLHSHPRKESPIKATNPKSAASPSKLLATGAEIDRNTWIYPSQQRLRHVQSHNDQSQLLIKPPIWCDTRQELCEALPYFKSYQGGHYTRNGRCFAYLLDGFPSARDVFADQGKVIISHGGGGNSTLDYKTGALKAGKDQKRGHRIAALVNCMKEGLPVALIAGEKYAGMESVLKSLSSRYAVLGFYNVTHCWSELDEGRIRYKFRFEWCQSQGEPWWASMTAQSSTLRSLTPLDQFVCQSCQTPSFQFYQESFLCLNEQCTAFFKSSHTSDTSHTYVPAFLFAAAQFYLKVPFELEQNRLSSLEVLDETQIKDLYYDSKGFLCDHCGKLNCRRYLEYFQCDFCKAAVVPDFKISDILQLFSCKPLSQHPKYAASIKHSAIRNREYELHTYTFPEYAGAVRHFIPRHKNMEADKILEQYLQGVGFQRNRLKASRLAGGFLSNSFTQNTGHPYKFAIACDTVPWDSAPTAIVNALNVIRKVTNMPSYFNEVLSMAYLPGQRMSFHSDAEKGVGPSIASLSLGSSSVLEFRSIATKPNTIVLQITLNHGDVCWMDGEGIQKLYEHQAVPQGFRIVATARQIDD